MRFPLAVLSPPLRLVWQTLRVVTISSLVGLVFSTLAAAALPVITVVLTKTFVDEVVVGGSGSTLMGVAGLIFLSGALSGLGPALLRLLGNQLRREASDHELGNLFTVSMQIVGIEHLEAPDFQNRIRAAQQHGCEAGAQLTLTVLSSVQAGFLAVSCWLALGTVHPILPILVLAIVIPATIGELRMAKKLALANRGLSAIDRREMFYRDLLTLPHVAQEIRIYQADRFLLSRMKRLRAASSHRQGQLDRSELRARAKTVVVTSIPTFVALAWLSLMTGHGAVTPGDVTLVIGTVLASQTAIAGLVRDSALCLKFYHLRRELECLITDFGTMAPTAGRQQVEPLAEGIEFRNVWFKYPGAESWALSDISMRIPAGDHVGLVGPNGSGKSTLVKLLCRFYEPTRGSIFWDGVDISELDPSDLRRRIGAVFQDPVRYDLTISENVSLCESGAADAIIDSLSCAGLKLNQISSEDGLETRLSRFHFADDVEGADGVDLSGGQWQRIGLARALYRGSRDLMILDEPTSNQDPESEKVLHEQVMGIRGRRTTLLISHRLGGLASVSRIFVLDKGNLIEEGTPEQLLRAGGRYWSMFTAQAHGYLAQAEASELGR